METINQTLSGKNKFVKAVYVILTLILVILYIFPSIGPGMAGIGEFLGSLNLGGNRSKFSYQLDSANKACQITGIGKYNETMLDIPYEISGNTVTSIGNSAFYYCSGFTNVTVPYSVRIIGQYAFSTCHDLENVNIVYGTEQIGVGAFMSSKKLRTITIPSSVKYIGAFSFYECTSLTTIRFGGTKSQWEQISFDTCWNENNNGCIVYCSDGVIS